MTPQEHLWMALPAKAEGRGNWNCIRFNLKCPCLKLGKWPEKQAPVVTESNPSRDLDTAIFAPGWISTIRYRETNLGRFLKAEISESLPLNDIDFDLLSSGRFSPPSVIDAYLIITESR